MRLPHPPADTPGASVLIRCPSVPWARQRSIPSAPPTDSLLGAGPAGASLLHTNGVNPLCTTVQLTLSDTNRNNKIKGKDVENRKEDLVL